MSENLKKPDIQKCSCLEDDYLENGCSCGADDFNRAYNLMEAYYTRELKKYILRSKLEDVAGLVEKLVWEYINKTISQESCDIYRNIYICSREVN